MSRTPRKIKRRKPFPISKKRTGYRQLVAHMLHVSRQNEHAPINQSLTTKFKRKFAQDIKLPTQHKKDFWLFRGEPSKYKRVEPHLPEYWTPSPSAALWYATVGDYGINKKDPKRTKKKLGGHLKISRQRAGTFSSSVPEAAAGFGQVFHQMGQSGHPFVLSELAVNRDLPHTRVKVQKAWLSKKGKQSFRRRVLRETSGNAGKLRTLAQARKQRAENPARYKKMRAKYFARKKS